MKTTLSNLQILRFLAAALVLVSHVQHEALKGIFLDISHYHPWTAIYFAGGVDIFFVISGFIMYTIASRNFGQPGAAPKFLLRRILRVVPPYWIFTTAMIGAALVFQHQVTHSVLRIGNIVASYCFWPYQNAYGKAYPVLMLGWTLNYEFFFYLVFSSALFFQKKIGLFLIFGVLGVLGTVGASLHLNQLPFSFWSNPIVFEFLFGILLAMMRERGFRFSALAGCCCVAIGFAAMWVLKDVGIAEHFWSMRALWMGLPALLICSGFVFVPEKAGVPGTIKRCLVLLGDASYAIYLSHPFSLNAIALLWGRSGWNEPWLYVSVAIIASLGVGVLVHVALEKPLTRYLNRRFGGLSTHGETSISLIARDGGVVREVTAQGDKVCP